MDCVLVAGGRPGPQDPLYDETQGKPKALLEIDGRPIVEFVLNALLRAQSVDRIVLGGLDVGTKLNIDRPPEMIVDQGGLVANGLAGLSRLLEQQPETRHVLFSSADIPSVTSLIVDDVVAACRPFDKAAYYFMVDRRTMERRFPDSERTFVQLKDMQVAGADMFIADARLASDNRRLLHDMAAGRKLEAGQDCRTRHLVRFVVTQVNSGRNRAPSGNRDRQDGFGATNSPRPIGHGH
jgi:GTP:adenosylcobinamide-phosphate guanylyltransferase